MFITTYSSVVNQATFCIRYRGGSLACFIDDGFSYGIYLNCRQEMFYEVDYDAMTPADPLFEEK